MNRGARPVGVDVRVLVMAERVQFMDRDGKLITESLKDCTVLSKEVGNKDYSPFDLVCHFAFDQPPLTRQERAKNVRKRS